MAVHGSVTRYVAGCRCDECRAAKAEYERQHRQERRRQEQRLHFHLLPDGEIGGHDHPGSDEPHNHGLGNLSGPTPGEAPDEVSETAPHEVPEGEACPTCQQVHEVMTPEEEALFAQLQKAQEQLALVATQRAYWQSRAYAAEDKLAEAKLTTEGKANAEGKSTTGYRPGRGNAKPTAPGKKVAEPVETKPPQPTEPEPQQHSEQLARPFVGQHTHKLADGRVVRHAHPGAQVGHIHEISVWNARRQH